MEEIMKEKAAIEVNFGALNVLLRDIITPLHEKYQTLPEGREKENLRGEGNAMANSYNDKLRALEKRSGELVGIFLCES